MLGKIFLYILSLWVLFILIILVSVKLPVLCFGAECSFFNFISYFWHNNFISFNFPLVVSIVLSIVGVIGFFWFKEKISGSVSLPIDILSVEDMNYEHLVFLTTYIIPLVCFNFESKRYIIVFFVLLLIIGLIYIKTDKYYSNPTLALLGYKLYKISTVLRNGVPCEVVVICRDDLAVGDKITYIDVEYNKIFYGKKI